MTGLAELFLVLKWAAVLAGPALISVFEAVQIGLLKKRNGAAIYRQKRTHWVSIAMGIGMFALFLPLSLALCFFPPALLR